MSEPWGIVVVATEAGMPLVLAGLCGARPPLVWLADGEPGWGRWANVIAGRKIPTGEGLPLRWDGALVPEGWDRARRVWWDRPRGVRVDVDAARAASLAFPAVEDVVRLARALESAGLCRVVLLDLVDGAVVERAP